MLTKLPSKIQKQVDEGISILKGEGIVAFPTDTVYGIGCNAKLEKSVERIREIKKQFDRPFSVIAPSIDWIAKNLEIKKEVRPGPYTFILKKKRECVAENVSFGDTLGVRIPKHEFKLSNTLSNVILKLSF